MPSAALLHDFMTESLTWLRLHALSASTLQQSAAILAAILLALLLSRTILRGKAASPVESDNRFLHLAAQLRIHCFSLIWFLLQLFALFIFIQLQRPHQLLKVTTSLLAVWVVVELTSSLFRSTVWIRIVAIAAWTLAALNILGLLEPAILMLDRLAFTLGGLRISLLNVLKAVFFLALLLWLAQSILHLFEKRIRAATSLSPSLQVLFVKLLKVLLLTVATVSALGIVGIDLTSFTVFTGAVGVGVGFGLQKIISNLISGIILLLDKSIKPGDVITIGDTYGWINSLGARYVSLITRDGREFLIPNEDLITHQVENWSFTNNAVRLKVPVGIHYKSDVRRAIELCLEASRETGRILSIPQPICLLIGFGDSSVNLELRFWIDDPTNGLGNVKSEVLLKIWDKFHQNGIEIPYPQRDLHIRSPQPIDVTVLPEEQG